MSPERARTAQPVAGQPDRNLPRNLPGELQGALDIDELVRTFAAAIAREGGMGHVCWTDGTDCPRILFGDTPGLAGIGDTFRERCIVFDVRAPDGANLRVVVVRAHGEWADRAAAARLHALAVLYAHRGLTLLEAGPNDEAHAITLREGTCLAGILAGNAWLDIGAGIGVGPHAVGVLLERAARKLGASDTAEAVAIAVRRGICTAS